MVTRTHEELAFTIEQLSELRALVARAAARNALETTRAHDLVLAVNELASNSVRHGGGAGVLRVWTEDRALHCEVSDRGYLAERLSIRKCPPAAAHSGRGLWLADQLCDGLRIDSSPESGCAVSVHMRFDS